MSARQYVNTRRIFFVTAARSEYDILFPVIQAAAADARLSPEVVAVAGQLSPFHGMGIERIRADGFRIAASVESLMSSESNSGRSLSFAHLTEGLTHLLSANRPDLIVVAGDREEPLAVAVVANFLGIPVAHLHGGDRCVASEVDEVLRPAISKLSHLHFTATEGHRERLIRMGERPELVWTTGAPGLDRLRTEPDVSAAALNREFGIDVSQPFFLLIYHPSPLFDPANSGAEMAEVLRGALAPGYPVFCSYPNYDPGNIAIRQAIDTARCDRLIVSHNLPRDRFVALYRRCAAILGNSSSILLEAGFLHVPGILIGDRQNLREAGANVVRVPAEAEAVRRAATRAIDDPDFRATVRNAPSLYGDGHAAPRIVAVLAEIDLTRALLQKTITY
jgi:GDP/UDP-N,N'-diacetylbacillosamine 2-epimerase (hydrolysing)